MESEKDGDLQIINAEKGSTRSPTRLTSHVSLFSITSHFSPLTSHVFWSHTRTTFPKVSSFSMAR